MATHGNNKPFTRPLMRIPLGQRAILDMRDIQDFDQVEIQRWLSAHKIIEDYIDRIRPEKDALKAFSVLWRVDERYLEDNLHNLHTNYNDFLVDMVIDFIQKIRTDDQGQAELALSIVDYEADLDVLRNPVLRRSFFNERQAEEFVREARAYLIELEGDKVYHSVPVLFLRLKTAITDCLQELAKPAPDCRPAPRP